MKRDGTIARESTADGRQRKATVAVRLSDEEQQLVRRAAQLDGRPVSGWIRRLIVREIARLRRDAATSRATFP